MVRCKDVIMLALSLRRRLLVSLALVLGTCGLMGPAQIRAEPQSLSSGRLSAVSPQRAAKQRHVLFRAVRDLPEDEEYPEHEIKDRKEERFYGACRMAAGALAVIAAVPARKPALITGAAAAFLEGLGRTDAAHRDVTKMSQHNERARARKDRNSDGRYRGDH